MTLDSEFILKALREIIIPHHSTLPTQLQTFSKITTDSRNAISDSLFVAIPGDIHDGHDFVNSAIRMGAKGVLIQREIPGLQTSKPDEILVVHVPNTLVAFRKIAAAWRGNFSIPVIAVAGSVGKTTTKELIASLLLGKFKNVLKTFASQNGFLGIPMTLLSLNPDHQVAVIEIGIDEKGAMSEHLQLVQPTHALVTSIAPEHMATLQTLDCVTQEECLALTQTANAGGIAIVNLGDARIRANFNVIFQTQCFGYEILSEGEVFIPQHQCIQGKFNKQNHLLSVSGVDKGKTFSFQINSPLPGFHNARNLLAAVTIAHVLGVTPDEMNSGIKSFQSPVGRSQVEKFYFPHLTSPSQNTSQITVFCDYYNAQPASMESALLLLSESEAQMPYRWACLGDMLELGPNEKQYHQALAELPCIPQIGNFLLYGPQMKHLYEKLLVRKHMGRVHHFMQQKELAEFLQRHILPGTYILIKGSRGMKMEETWERLKAHFISQGANQIGTP